jgi:hypothetical protein
MMKIDVEGAENDVIQGAASTLAEHQPVLLIELHEENLACFSACPKDVVENLRALGYALYRTTKRGLQPLAELPHGSHFFNAAALPSSSLPAGPLSWSQLSGIAATLPGRRGGR